MNLDRITDVLAEAGYSLQTKGSRLYVRKDGQDYGYLVAGDDGSTGTCAGIHRRQGTIASLLRDARATSA